MAIHAEAKSLSNKTSNAYMCDTYKSHWIKCASLLLDVGFTFDDAEQVLRSKHMRWADDHSGESTLYGFSVYLAKYIDRIKKDVAEWSGETK